MDISINWPTGVITVLKADLSLVEGNLYEMDIEEFRTALRLAEYSSEGMAWPETHSHRGVQTLSGVTYARSLEIINGYTITFAGSSTPYRVRFSGANHNIGDVANLEGLVSLIITNSAGLIVTQSGGQTGGQTSGPWGIP